MCSTPVIVRCRPGTARALYSFLASAVYRMLLTSEDLPEPETPVTAISLPKGNSTVTLRRLCSVAPWTVMAWPLPVRRVDGMGIQRRPDR